MLGNEVRTAYDGEAGSARRSSSGPAVVFCDIGMPKVNGYEAAAAFENSRGAVTWCWWP